MSLIPQHVKRATKERGFQLDRPLYLVGRRMRRGDDTKLPLKAFKGAKLVLTSVMPCRWKRVPFVINEVTNHFIKRLSHTHTPRRVNSPSSLPLSPSIGSHTNAGLLQQSMLILLRLTHLWCTTKPREITPRINVVPSLFFSFLFLLSAYVKTSSSSPSCLTGPRVLYLLITQFSPNKPGIKDPMEAPARTYIFLAR